MAPPARTHQSPLLPIRRNPFFRTCPKIPYRIPSSDHTFFSYAPTIVSVFLARLSYPLRSSFLLASFSRLFLSAVFSQLFSVSHLPSHRLSALLRRPPRKFRRRRRIYLADAIHPRRGTPRLPKAGTTTTYSKRGTRKDKSPFRFLFLCSYYSIYFAYIICNFLFLFPPFYIMRNSNFVFIL